MQHKRNEKIKITHTILPEHSPPFPPEKIQKMNRNDVPKPKWKKSLLTDTVPEFLRCGLAVVIPPHLTLNHVLHRECPRYLAAFPWLVSKCWGLSAFLCKMFLPEDCTHLQTELPQNLHTLELLLKLTGTGNKAFRFATQNGKRNTTKAIKNF